MKKLILLLTLFALSLKVAGAEIIPFHKWPQLKTQYGRVLVAENQLLSHQGFGGASAADCRKTFIWFPDISEGTEFENCDHGYGPVIVDIGIAFLNESGKVLKISVMKAKKGNSIAPQGTSAAVEAIPSLLKKAGFKEGKQAPFFLLPEDMPAGNTAFRNWKIVFPEK